MISRFSFVCYHRKLPLSSIFDLHKQIEEAFESIIRFQFAGSFRLLSTITQSVTNSWPFTFRHTFNFFTSSTLFGPTFDSFDALFDSQLTNILKLRIQPPWLEENTTTIQRFKWIEKSLFIQKRYSHDYTC